MRSVKSTERPRWAETQYIKPSNNGRLKPAHDFFKCSKYNCIECAYIRYRVRQRQKGRVVCKGWRGTRYITSQ